MAKRIRRVGSVANELVKKSREAMLTAVQIYNNPQVYFKSELFIVTTVIAWTYLLHAYYRKHKINYRQISRLPGRNKYATTPRGAIRLWSLEDCLGSKESPVELIVKQNLLFLIGIRHEIEHQGTSQIDDQLSAKFMSAALNFNAAIKKHFGAIHSLEKEQAFSIQFSTFDENTAKELLLQSDLPANIRTFITDFERSMSDEDYNDPRFSFRVAFIRKLANGKASADKLVEFVPAGTTSDEMNRVYVKETEKTKYRPKQIVDMMREEGYKGFTMHQHTELWQGLNAKMPEGKFGTMVAETTWLWYPCWIEVVRKRGKCSAIQTENHQPLLHCHEGRCLAFLCFLKTTWVLFCLPQHRSLFLLASAALSAIPHRSLSRSGLSVSRLLSAGNPDERSKEELIPAGKLLAPDPHHA